MCDPDVTHTAVCVGLGFSAPCSCLCYHHESKRVFVGQDNGAVVVSDGGGGTVLWDCAVKQTVLWDCAVKHTVL